MSRIEDSPVRLLHEHEIRALIGPREALAAVREAFAAFADGQASLPAVLDFEFPAQHGEAHIKGAHLHGATHWSVKAATAFYDNPARGLPVTDGLSLVFSATTGKLELLLLDNGYLTELRTGSAGALAADLLANPAIEQATIVGAGSQARYQLEALLLVRRPQRVVVWSRTRAAARRYAAEMHELHQLDISAADDLARAVRGADLLITTTPARTPLVRPEWLRAGVHITAIGSDMAGKQELETGVLARADLVAADHPPAAVLHGELQHGIATGAVELHSVVALADLVVGRAPGRRADADITVADLVGLGIQDAAVSNAVQHAARHQPNDVEVLAE